MSAATTPAEVLRSGLERHGWTIEGLPDDATHEQVVDICAHLLRELERRTPASPEALAGLEPALRAINDARGTAHTVETVAAACGVDLGEATRADVSRMAVYVGGTLMAS